MTMATATTATTTMEFNFIRQFVARKSVFTQRLTIIKLYTNCLRIEHYGMGSLNLELIHVFNQIFFDHG